ncbi:MAG: YfcE family phosphodiesterase [Firmicutes bacterium]|nr:YfcE family phosphodiesterase [Bacillota bacterium]MCD8311801.1 YfcE family phosphodiesterase [Bacillota bacterium]MCD8315272.1 YfcE family phosphodiesterase [Bacillota bacterium]
MKLLIVSDVHGDTDSLSDTVSLERPDTVIFCGDGVRDVDFVSRRFPAVGFASVAGNCDIFSDAPVSLSLKYGAASIFVTHGHKYMAKQTDSVMLAAAARAGANILLYGHTHRAVYSVKNGIHVLNPGSLAYGRSYGVITTDTNGFECELKRI